jgi:hypothetical protein
LVEVDVQIGDQCLAVGGELVVSIFGGLQRSGAQQPIPQIHAATPGEVVVAGANLSQRCHLAVLAQRPHRRHWRDVGESLQHR